MIRILICTILFFAVLESTMAAFIPKAFNAEFIQKKKLMNGGSLKTDIQLKYQYPGRIYMHSQGLDEDVYYVCNPRKVWIYNPPFIEGEKGRVLIGNSSVDCLSKVFDQLKNGLKNNKQYSVKKLNETSYLLTFSKANEKKLGYQKIEMVFTKASANFSDLKLIRMYSRNDKNPTLLTRKSLKPVKGFKDSTFKFQIPKNTQEDYM